MLAPHAFFSFTTVTRPLDHAAYNEWHQLDHRPENLALDGVRHGERWVRTPACRAASVADARLESTHYVNLYWFRAPVDVAVAQWQALAERSFQWGRRPDMDMCSRPLMGFFDVVKGYVSPHAKVSVEALPFRPTRGVIVQVLELDDPHSIEVERLFGWYDTVAIPAALALEGVAGAYTFASVTSTIDAGYHAESNSRTFAPEAAARAGSLRVTVFFCDRDILDTNRALDMALTTRRDTAPSGDPHRAARAGLLFDSAVDVIEPWRWHWFDQAAP
jgi:hypothetical protein